MSMVRVFPNRNISCKRSQVPMKSNLDATIKSRKYSPLPLVPSRHGEGKLDFLRVRQPLNPWPRPGISESVAESPYVKKQHKREEIQSKSRQGRLEPLNGYHFLNRCFFKESGKFSTCRITSFYVL